MMNFFSEENQILEQDQVVDGNWEILAFIAKGGKGEVYLAKQLNLNRKVALKVISKEFLESLEGSEEDYESELQRFRREVQVMAKIRHPNVLQVYDFHQIQVNGNALDYIVMEYVPGPTLRQTMLEEGFQNDEAAVAGWLKKYFFPVLRGMEAVHALGVLHRDLKPENVLIDDEIPKIVDFGLAGGHDYDDITRSHHVIGTFPYMPEEQFIDLATTDARTDVYSLGKILYEAIEGKMTQKRDRPFKTVQLSAPSSRFFSRIDRVIQNATAKNRNQRTSSVSVLRKELADIIQESVHADTVSHTKRHKRQLLLTGTIGAFLILLLAGAFGLHLIRMESGTNAARNKRVAVVPSENYNFDFKTRPPASPEKFPLEKPLPETISGSDGMVLRLVPGGEVQFALDRPDAPDRQQIMRTETVSSFYMDETKITNHLYVEFLRSVQGLVIQDNTISRNGEIWLLLGEVLEGYEPIVYEDGKFKIKPGAASNPVVRVTPIGTMAYAKFYGRTLPTMAQWMRAVQAKSPKNQTGRLPEQNKDPGKIQHVLAFKSNPLGIFGLGRNVNEWTIYRPDKHRIEFHIHGGLGELDGQQSYLQRHSWEASARVGFRTVRNVPSKEP